MSVIERYHWHISGGYKGQKEFGKTRLLTPSVPQKTDSQYDQRKQRKRFRKRAGMEVTISHSKQHFRMEKYYLKGELWRSDQCHTCCCSLKPP